MTIKGIECRNLGLSHQHCMSHTISTDADGHDALLEFICCLLLPAACIMVLIGRRIAGKRGREGLIVVAEF